MGSVIDRGYFNFCISLVKGDVAFDVGRVVERGLIAPRGFVNLLSLGLEIPIGRISLDRAMGVKGRYRFDELGVNVFGREIEHRIVHRLTNFLQDQYLIDEPVISDHRPLFMEIVW